MCNWIWSEHFILVKLIVIFLYLLYLLFLLFLLFLFVFLVFLILWWLVSFRFRFRRFLRDVWATHQRHQVP